MLLAEPLEEGRVLGCDEAGVTTLKAEGARVSACMAIISLLCAGVISGDVGMDVSLLKITSLRRDVTVLLAGGV